MLLKLPFLASKTRVITLHMQLLRMFGVGIIARLKLLPMFLLTLKKPQTNLPLKNPNSPQTVLESFYAKVL